MKDPTFEKALEKALQHLAQLNAAPSKPASGGRFKDGGDYAIRLKALEESQAKVAAAITNLSRSINALTAEVVLQSPDAGNVEASKALDAIPSYDPFAKFTASLCAGGASPVNTGEQWEAHPWSPFYAFEHSLFAGSRQH